uniref:(northern house mosquito) hypothetical protein n=1 Tax=Culex pipiens TaxID=7175 RepID=A0A8D8A3B7_CULPI
MYDDFYSQDEFLDEKCNIRLTVKCVVFGKKMYGKISKFLWYRCITTPLFYGKIPKYDANYLKKRCCLLLKHCQNDNIFYRFVTLKFTVSSSEIFMREYPFFIVISQNKIYSMVKKHNGYCRIMVKITIEFIV